MLRSAKDLEGYAVQATDGLIGHVKDVYFDDQQWVARYFVVETGHWLSSRKVLISPLAIGRPDWTGSLLPVSINQEQVKNSPDIDTDKPVSRQHESRHLGYYGYPNYWGWGGGLWGSGAYPGEMLANVGYGGCYADYLEGQPAQDPAQAEAEHGDHHLRSCNAVMKYQIQATDGDIGHVVRLLVDEDTWAVRYMVVETGSWWVGHQVLIAPQWIQEVRWSDSTVAVALTRQAVKDAPWYDAAVPLSREYEMDLYRHHGRGGYWAQEVKPENPDFRVTASSSQGIHQIRDGVMHDKRLGI